MKRFIKMILCAVGFHFYGVKALGTVMTVTGPKFKYQCKGCKRIILEDWDDV